VIFAGFGVSFRVVFGVQSLENACGVGGGNCDVIKAKLQNSHLSRDHLSYLLW
jgi:hypothetical protein